MLKAFSRFVLAAVLGLALHVSPANALPLGLTLDNVPDILSNFADVTYVSGTSTFSVDGFSAKLDDDGVGAALDIDPSTSTFALTASIDGSGTLLSGSFVISGTVGSPLNFNSGTLLTGTLTDFGFGGGLGQTLEFLFSVTGGDAETLFGGNGNQGGLLVHQTGFGGGAWGADFNNNAGNAGTGSGSVDAATIPEPSVLILALMSIGLIAVLRAVRVPHPARVGRR